MDDLEGDPEYRQNVNIFKDPSKAIPVDTNDMVDPSIPRITLEEMLDDLVLDDVEMSEDERHEFVNSIVDSHNKRRKAVSVCVCVSGMLSICYGHQIGTNRCGTG